VRTTFHLLHHPPEFTFLVTDVALSDHLSVLFEGDICVHMNFQTDIISKQHITEKISELFIKAFSFPLNGFS